MISDVGCVIIGRNEGDRLRRLPDVACGPGSRSGLCGFRFY